MNLLVTQPEPSLQNIRESRPVILKLLLKTLLEPLLEPVERPGKQSVNLLPQFFLLIYSGLFNHVNQHLIRSFAILGLEQLFKALDCRLRVFKPPRAFNHKLLKCPEVFVSELAQISVQELGKDWACL